MTSLRSEARKRISTFAKFKLVLKVERYLCSKTTRIAISIDHVTTCVSKFQAVVQDSLQPDAGDDGALVCKKRPHVAEITSAFVFHQILQRQRCQSATVCTGRSRLLLTFGSITVSVERYLLLW